MSQKWNLQDIRPADSGRDRVRRVPPTGSPRSDIGVRQRPPSQIPPQIDPDLASIDIIDGNSQRRKRILISTVIAFVILGAGYFVNVMLGGAEVTVNPKFKDVSVQATFTAYAEPKAGELSYELLTLEATSEKQVKASGQETVSERAVGNILIYNTRSGSTQRLIKNTRFENPDGLIYRIQESVEVPSATKDAAGKLIPGVITAQVFADGPGEQYNIRPSRFTVPGLKGTDQYDSIYGESTVGFTGGFEGDKYIIDEGELNTAKQALHVELRDTLLARLKNERPAGFILFEPAVTFAFDSLPPTEYGDSLATIKERARLQVPIFKEAEFSKYIAENTIAGYEGDPVSMTNPLSLNYAYTSATATVSDIAPLKELEFTLRGESRVVWLFDEEQLKNDISGLQKTAMPKVLTEGYPSISSAKSVVRPFWAQTFPENPKEIEVITIIGDSKATQ
jgi:hypothetical protein